MFWREKKTEYDILVPPLSKPVNQFTEAEAQAYFEWYIEKIEERVNYLSSYTKLNLDYSPNSLVRLWGWFLKNAKIETTPKARLADLEKELTTSGSPFTNDVLNENARQLSLETEYIIRDIGMYWGEVFVKNHSSVYWGFYTTPKKDSFVNHPLLLGFPNEIFPDRDGPPFEPIHMAKVQASKLLRRTASPNDLLQIHRVWERKIYEAD